MYETNERMGLDVQRFEQLIKSEHDANYLKSLIAEKYEHYGTFSREELKILYTMFIGKEEE